MKSKTTSAVLLTSLMAVFGTAYAATDTHGTNTNSGSATSASPSMGTDDGKAGGQGAGVNTGPAATGMPDDDRSNEGTEHGGAKTDTKR
ncbi:hypothetical protein [Pseudomonas sp. Marseille-QA0892]